MMRLALTLLTALGVALPVSTYAATQVDTNGDGLLTIDEVQAMFPEITAETFTAMDVNADGALDADEVVAAQQAGLMPASEG